MVDPDPRAALRSRIDEAIRRSHAAQQRARQVRARAARAHAWRAAWVARRAEVPSRSYPPRTPPRRPDRAAVRGAVDATASVDVSRAATDRSRH